MTIAQHHVPAPHEGGCTDCTADYRDHAPTLLETFAYFGDGRLLDNQIVEHYNARHAEECA